MAVTQVTSIPIFNLRIPYNVNQRSQIRVHLNDALEQPDMYVENKMIVPKVKKYYLLQRCINILHQS